MERRIERVGQDPPATNVSSIQICTLFSVSAERNVAAEEQDNVIGLHKSSSNQNVSDAVCILTACSSHAEWPTTSAEKVAFITDNMLPVLPVTVTSYKF